MLLNKSTRSVNPQVVGSSPTGGAKKNTTQMGGVLFGLFGALAPKNSVLADSCYTDCA